MANDILDMQSYVEFSKRINALEAKNEELGSKVSLLEGKTQALETTVAELQRDRSNNEAKLTAIEAKLTKNEAKLADSEAMLTKNEAKLTAIEAKLTAIISTLAPGNLVALHASGRSDGKTLFENKSDYGVVVRSERTHSKFFKRGDKAAIDLGSHSDSLVIISIPELGLHHIYEGNAPQLQWKGFPNRLIVAPDATSLIPPISCFTEEQEVVFTTDTSNITVKNESEHGLPIQVWNGSAFSNVAHRAKVTLPTTRFATIVVRDPKTQVTRYYQGIARHLTFTSFKYPSELQFDTGFYFLAESTGNSLRLRNRHLAENDLDHAVFHRRDKPWATLEVFGTLWVKNP
ncbi:hypothetical protein BJ741DRAFT_685001 [Chytriomyces cf. hyalinus JEL632]|nr:hypothetical protein BJ741DRAFT_685001 [Chytriomyces cf. hyalinus JEL632]